MQSETRRLLLKGGLGAAPIVMTVASRPVFGAQCTPSAWVSGNLSNPDKLRDTCGGRSPGYWMARPGLWPDDYQPGTCADSGPGTCSNYNSDGTPFHESVMSPLGFYGPFFGSTFGSLTMMQVLWLGGTGDPYQLGAHIVAALLNAASIPDYGMSEATVIEIYRQLETQGFYQTSTGIPMYPEDVVLFIQNTFD